MRVYLHGEVSQPGLCVSPRVREERWKRCPDAGLMDGSVPTIGNGVASITGLEPAVWFKVLIVDAVCLDFVSNSLLWTTCRYKLCTQRIMGDNGFQRCKHAHECLLNEDFHLPDVDLDRGLELAKHILVRQKEDDLVDLLHLLHVYILPIIRLHSEDKEHVTEALTNQKLEIKKLDTEIDQMSDQRTKIREDMKKWREDICKDLQTEKAIVSCNTAFLKLLCTHLEVDIRNSYVELDSCQKKVEEAKLKVLRKEGDNYITHLKRVRSIRDRVAERITKSLFVVEEVGLMVRLSKSPDNQKLNEMHTAYIKTQEGWESYTKDLSELQRKKVCATSVREALFTTEAELKTGADTTGVEYISTGTEQATDVLGPSHLPSGWETLQSQVVKSLEYNPVIRQLHYDFNVWIRRFCTSELEDQRHGSNWMGKIPCTHVEDSSNVSCLRVSPDKFSRIRQTIKERKPSAHFQGLTKTLQNEVFLHFQQVVDNLVRDAAVPSTCFSRLWTSYERCFFSRRGRDVLRLYQRAYASETKTLKATLPEVTVRDLELDDEWILNILGLYAPDFKTSSVTHDFEQLSVQPQVGEEVREKTDDEEAGESRPRERLESGIDIHDEEGVVHRRKVSRTWGQRYSNRYTKIIDLMWVETQAKSERSSTWSGIERSSRGSSRLEDSDALSMATSAPDVKSPRESNQEPSIPINIPNTNSNATTFTPITSLVGDSGVCLNKEGESVETTGYHDPLGHSCQDNPNIRVFLERFQTAYHCFRVVLQDTVPMAKLQWLYRCIQQVNSTAEKQSQLIFCGKCRMLSGDDLLTSLILFLLHGDIDEVASGYHQLMMLQDYLPDFLDKGHFGFTVLQFLLAYSYILRHAEREKGIDL
ncbi:uncharacterized protein LOC117291473 [Asterias rubens]|uniref:uncharacterized protein LOC117291473 n=1 Tax=Asterias rubens TaxID=7604 RepID=UPI001455B9E6|nr:uncharacterized protein LOC117291473 [Asterias rubens]